MGYEIIGKRKIKIPEYITSSKKIETAIARGEKWLIKLKKKYGIYENFGEGIARKINEKFINSSSYSDKMNERRKALDSFNNWRYKYN